MIMMHKSFILLAALFTLLGLSTAVQAVPLKRETNAARFARGLPPLPPVNLKRTEGMSLTLYFFIELTYSLRTTLTVAKRAQPSSVLPGP